MYAIIWVIYDVFLSPTLIALFLLSFKIISRMSRVIHIITPSEPIVNCDSFLACYMRLPGRRVIGIRTAWKSRTCASKALFFTGWRQFGDKNTQREMKQMGRFPIDSSCNFIIALKSLELICACLGNGGGEMSLKQTVIAIVIELGIYAFRLSWSKKHKGKILPHWFMSHNIYIL